MFSFSLLIQIERLLFQNVLLVFIWPPSSYTYNTVYLIEWHIAATLLSTIITITQFHQIVQHLSARTHTHTHAQDVCVVKTTLSSDRSQCSSVTFLSLLSPWYICQNMTVLSVCTMQKLQNKNIVFDFLFKKKKLPSFINSFYYF